MTSKFKGFTRACDKGIVFGLCGCIFVLPAAIAYLDSFAALAILSYILKKAYQLCEEWPLKVVSLNPLEKFLFGWKAFAPPVNVLNGPLQWLAMAMFISVIMSQYPMLSLLAFFGKFVKSVFLYFSFIEVMADRKRLKIFLFFFFFSAFIAVLSGIYQHHYGKDFIKGNLIGKVNNISTGRISSAFHHPNAFAVYLLPVIALVVHFLRTAWVQHSSWLIKVAWALFLAGLMLCLCLTYSRSAWLGFLIIILTMILIDWRKIFFAGILLLVFILFFIPSLAQVRNVSLINDNVASQHSSTANVFNIDLNNSGSGRLLYWKNAVSIFRTSPVWGTGLNTYTKMIERNPDKKIWWYAHNCYLQLLAETGILGLGAFLWMIFTLLTYGINSCRTIQDPWVLALVQGSVCGLFGYFLECFFDNTFFNVQLGLLMWIMFGLLVAATQFKPALEK